MTIFPHTLCGGSTRDSKNPPQHVVSFNTENTVLKFVFHTRTKQQTDSIGGNPNSCLSIVFLYFKAFFGVSIKCHRRVNKCILTILHKWKRKLHLHITIQKFIPKSLSHLDLPVLIWHRCILTSWTVVCCSAVSWWLVQSQSWTVLAPWARLTVTDRYLLLDIKVSTCRTRYHVRSTFRTIMSRWTNVSCWTRQRCSTWCR